MQETPISDKHMSILRKDYANPFSKRFDFKKIADEIGEDNSEKEEEVLTFIVICNQTFTEINEHFSQVFSDLNLTKNELIEFLFKAINKNSLDLAPMIVEQMFDNKKTAYHIGDFNFTKFLFKNGNEGSVQQVFELGGDILNVLLSAVNNYRINIDQIFPRETIGEEKLGRIFSYLWNPANILLNMQSAYRVLIFENGEIEDNDNFESLKITTGNKWLRILRQTSEIRSESNLSEYLYPLLELYKRVNPNKVGIKNYKSINGLINLTTTKKNESNSRALADASLMSRYYHYQTEKLNYYNDLTLSEINEILIHIVDFVSFIYLQSVEKGNNNSIYDAPSQIKKNHLIEYLIECTGYGKEVIDKVILSLSSKSKAPNLWRKPFYEIGDNLFFSIVSLNAPNYSILYEGILNEAGYLTKKNELLLIKTIEEELDSEKIEFKFNKVDFEELGEDPNDYDNNLIYELNDYYIFIQTKSLTHPFESHEIDAAISEIAESTFQILEKLEFLSKKVIDKPILPLILSNYNTFTSLSINNIVIIDLQLLKNYFITGSFRRGQISFEKEIRVQREYAKIEYYKGEKEFNNNFLNFIVNPPPLSTIYERLCWKESVITPPKFHPKITIESIDQISADDTIYNHLSVLENALNNKYYYDRDSRTKELYDSSISYSLTNVLHLIAFGDHELSKTKIDLYHILKKYRIEGFGHILISLNDAIKNISYSKIKKDKTFNIVAFDEKDVAINLFSKIFEDNQSSKQIRLNGYEIRKGLFSKNEEKQLVSLALSALSTLGPHEISDDQFEGYFLQLAIIKGLKTKYQLDFEFYSACDNLIDTLNFNNKYQRARNFAEEILTIAIDENNHHFGWGILFRCFTYQSSVFEASIYGALYFTSLSRVGVMKYSIITELLYNALKYFRNFRLYDMLEDINNVISEIRLKKYDEQKFKLSYYLSSIQIIKNKPEIFNESLHYLEENLKDIISFDDKGTLPWLNYLYNVKRYKDAGFDEFNKPIEEYIQRLESSTDSDKVEKLKSNHFGDKASNKIKLINSLIGVFETNIVGDFKFEVKHLEVRINILLPEAIKDNDIDSILLSGIVINDNSLTYNNKYYSKDEVVKITPGSNKELENKLNNYKDFIINSIIVKDNQLFVWLFNIHKRVYVLTINSKKDIHFKELSEWNYDLMNKWIKSKEKFYFDSSQYFDIGEQESKYSEILNDLSFSNLKLQSDFDEILFTSSIELSEFPTNLIVNNENFISVQTSITNVISLEWYIQKGNEVVLKNDFSSTAWIPIDDGDIPINLSFSKFQPVLKEHGTEILTSRNILEQIKTDVNIFLAHGELGFKSFKGIYTNHDSESAILYPKELFGKGEIAILFICNSGVSNEDFFANGVTSLCYDILDLGYKAVVAPFWRLETTIPSYWYEEFIKSFKGGCKLSNAVHLANLSLAEYKEGISTGFVAPEGRLAMHIYGNPNITIAQGKIS
ncbi:hypothetical protein DZC72_11850 [Maribacter algicola]|uniref:CHAT domain-containing protein n=1 Tax=Maribacter algicola TaxID=2498892 RepID=A0A426RHH6_9FLAO|nr:hypothetical protein [Maribacter algicola]RRQ48396.1 hypothetical protein DZC72_11850 [Maribacter algicola]